MDDPEAQYHHPGLVALAILLWALTSGLSIVLIPSVMNLFTDVYAAFWADYEVQGRTYWGAVAIRQLSAVPLAILAVAVIMGGAEYHQRNFGKAQSWQVYTRTLAVELSLLLMAWII